MTATSATEASATTRRAVDIDSVNIVLMVVAGAAAYLAPFETFLIAYAVLGPLHYLTEIGWLHQRAYYLPERARAIPLLGLGIVAAALNWSWIKGDNVLADTGAHATALAVLLAIAFVVLRNRWVAVAAVVPSYLVARWLRRWDGYSVWIVYLVPTLLHVFVFTLMFVVFGALKSKRRRGLVSACVMVGIGLALLAVRSGSTHEPTSYTTDSYGPFSGLNNVVLTHFHLVSPEVLGRDPFSTVFTSGVGVALMRLIAFAYAYHYLNWFSKTRVINWHRAPRSWLFAVAVGWLVAVAVYAQSYARGLKVLFLLSYVHVLLELPLNVRTAGGIVQELWHRRRVDAPEVSGASSRPS